MLAKRGAVGRSWVILGLCAVIVGGCSLRPLDHLTGNEDAGPHLDSGCDGTICSPLADALDALPDRAASDPPDTTTGDAGGDAPDGGQDATTDGGLDGPARDGSIDASRWDGSPSGDASACEPCIMSMCSSEIGTCSQSPSCQETMDCLRICRSKECQDGCITARPDAAEAARKVLECVGAKCGGVCFI